MLSLTTGEKQALPQHNSPYPKQRKKQQLNSSHSSCRLHWWEREHDAASINLTHCLTSEMRPTISWWQPHFFLSFPQEKVSRDAATFLLQWGAQTDPEYDTELQRALSAAIPVAGGWKGLSLLWHLLIHSHGFWAYLLIPQWLHVAFPVFPALTAADDLLKVSLLHSTVS